MGRTAYKCWGRGSVGYSGKVLRTLPGPSFYEGASKVTRSTWNDLCEADTAELMKMAAAGSKDGRIVLAIQQGLIIWFSEYRCLPPSLTA